MAKKKLSDEQVKEIRRLGESIGCKELGRMFNVSPNHVSAIVNFKARRKIDLKMSFYGNLIADKHGLETHEEE